MILTTLKGRVPESCRYGGRRGLSKLVAVGQGIFLESNDKRPRSSLDIYQVLDIEILKSLEPRCTNWLSDLIGETLL